MEITINNKLEIKGADKELKEYLKNLLTFENPKWLEAKQFKRSTRGIPKYLTQYERYKSSIIVPRGLFQHLLDDLGRDFQVIDQRIAAVSPQWPIPKVRLRDNGQEQAAWDLLSQDNGFCSAPAGSGKTVLGIEVCRRLRQKALWLTDRKELKDQAINTAINLFNLAPENIGILHGNKWEPSEFLTIGMLPSMQRRDLEDLSKYFGTVVIDEAHHVPCTRFLSVVSQFWAKNIYGLTATAYRSDQLENLMFNAVGPIIAEIGHQDLFAEEELIKPLIIQKTTHWYPVGAPDMLYHDFMETMTSDVRRNNLILQDVKQEVQAGNPCIVLVDRTKHAEILTSLLQKMGIKAEYLVAAVDREILDEEGNLKKIKKALPVKVRDETSSNFKAGKLQVLVATSDMLAEGYDHKPLNRLFMAAPVKWKGTVTQIIGRVQRVAPGKTDARVYDYVDEKIGMFERQALYRLNEVYQPMGMEVKYR